MIRATSRTIGTLLITFAAACGGDSITPPPAPPPPPPANVGCAGITPLVLAVGTHTVVDPAASSGCVVLPASGNTQAEYLVVPVSGSGLETTAGVVGPFLLQSGGATASSPTTAPSIQRSRPHRLTAQARFDGFLRAKEAELAREAPGESRLKATAPPPALGSSRSFNVCETLQCSSFKSVQATARYVGTHAAVYLDTTVPGTDTLKQSDIDDLGRTFDLFLFDIATAAFGEPSDIDANDVVMILLSDQVNDLTPDCTNGRILGFFFGGDLLPNNPGSNNGEVFYAFVPAPGTSTCNAVSPKQATDAIKGTLIHEFQHMISWNQHVTLRAGASEQTWLNEALSHVAEEMGGRLVPDAECAGFSSCRSLYTSGNLVNAFDYLSETGSHFMLFPGNSGGTLEERGASWLFLRWVIDQFANDPEFLGPNVTTALLGTTRVGSANIEAVTGASFPQLVAEWQLTNYLDDLPGFTPVSTRIQYFSWGLRDVFERNAPPNGTVFDRPFPMVPEVITAPAPFSRSGSLRGGSGQTFRVLLPPNTGATAVQIVRNASGAPIDPTLVPRVGVARIR